MNSIVIYNDPNLFSQPLFHKGPQFSARMFLARIRLFSSSTRIHGTESTLYNFTTSLFQPFKSDTWTHGIPSFWIACVQAALRSSSDTLITARPLSLKSSYSFTILGFSIRQGPHHEAQKSMIFNFPFTLYSDTCPPSGVGKVKSGAWAAIYYK